MLIILLMYFVYVSPGDYGNYCGTRISLYGIMPIDDVDDNCRIMKICLNSAVLPNDISCCKSQAAYLAMGSPKNINPEAEIARRELILNGMNEISKCNSFNYISNLANNIHISGINVRSFGFNYYTIFGNYLSLRFTSDTRGTFVISTFNDINLYLYYAKLAYNDQKIFSNLNTSIKLEKLLIPIDDPIIVVANIANERAELIINDETSNKIISMNNELYILRQNMNNYKELNISFGNLMISYLHKININEYLESIVSSKDIALISICFIVMILVNILILLCIYVIKKNKKNTSELTPLTMNRV